MRRTSQVNSKKIGSKMGSMAIPRMALLATCCLLGFFDAAAAQTLKKISVTVPQTAPVFFPLWYGEEQGFFAKQGLTVQVISTNGDGPDVDAVIAGSAQFALTTPNRLFTAFEQGRPLKVVMTVVKQLTGECVMNTQTAEKAGVTQSMPFAKKIAALKGTVVAGTRPGAFTYVLMEIYLKRGGLVPQKDVKVIGLGSTNAIVAALENNQIAAFCTGSPTLEMEQARGKVVNITDNASGTDPAFNDFAYEVIYANPDMLAKDPDTVRKFLSALKMSIDSMLDTPSATLLPSLKAHFGGVPDEIMIAGFDNLKKFYSHDGMTTPTGIDNAGKFMLETGAIKKAATFNDVATNDYLPKP
jgi:NitT/TauT family transport system substrate-binding protein